MQSPKPDPPAAQRKPPEKAGLWPYLPVLLLGSMVAGLLLMIRIATDDPHFAVETEYYQKALDWDQTQAQAEKNRALGWKVELVTKAVGSRTELRARVLDKAGQPVPTGKVSVEAFANVAAGARTKLSLQRSAGGDYRGQITPKHFGLWEFRFVVLGPGGPFTQTIRADVAGEDAS
ncbi:MAG TPA: FixH family protein [Polyangiaceae bacterium]|nr:FixH family protein [Polyangiaceae bacterium]